MLAEVALRNENSLGVHNLCLCLLIPILCGILICKEKIRSTIAHLFGRKKANPHERKECHEDGTSQNYQVITTKAITKPDQTKRTK